MSSVTRRHALRQAGRAATALALGLPAADGASGSQSAAQSATKPLKVVVAGGHPGDPGYGCGGTIARYTSLGHEVVQRYLNNGEWPRAKGGAPASTRTAETAKACEILRARPAYAGQVNGRAVLDTAHVDQFCKILEAERPDMVFPQWPIDQHRDHRGLAMRKKFALY